MANGQIIFISARDKEPLPGLNTVETKIGTGKKLACRQSRVWVEHPYNSRTGGRWRQQGQKFKVILSYIMNLSSALVT